MLIMKIWREFANLLVALASLAFVVLVLFAIFFSEFVVEPIKRRTTRGRALARAEARRDFLQTMEVEIPLLMQAEADLERSLGDLAGKLAVLGVVSSALVRSNPSPVIAYDWGIEEPDAVTHLRKRYTVLALEEYGPRLNRGNPLLVQELLPPAA